MIGQTQNDGLWGYYGVDSYGRPMQQYPAISGNPQPYTGQPTPPSQAGGQENAPQAPITEAQPKQQTPRGNAPAPPRYQATQLPRRELPTYQPGAVPQYQAPNTGDTEALQKTMINRILSSPETFSPEVMDALRAKVQTEATTLGDQSRSRILDSAASRGVGVPGYVASLLGEVDRGVNSDIISGRTNLLVEKAKQDAADRAQAQALAESYLNGTVSRAGSNYQNTLSGVDLLEALKRAGVESGARNVLFQQDQDLKQLDENRFAYGTEADQYRFDSELGLNYAQLEAQQQAELIRQILGL